MNCWEYYVLDDGKSSSVIIHRQIINERAAVNGDAMCAVLDAIVRRTLKNCNIIIRINP